MCSRVVRRPRDGRLSTGMRTWRGLSMFAAAAIVVMVDAGVAQRRATGGRSSVAHRPRRSTTPPSPTSRSTSGPTGTLLTRFPVRADHRIGGRDHGRRGVARGGHRRHRREGRRDRFLRRHEVLERRRARSRAGCRRHRDVPQRRRRLHVRVLRRRRQGRRRPRCRGRRDHQGHGARSPDLHRPGAHCE